MLRTLLFLSALGLGFGFLVPSASAPSCRSGWSTKLRDGVLVTDRVRQMARDLSKLVESVRSGLLRADRVDLLELRPRLSRIQ